MGGEGLGLYSLLTLPHVVVAIVTYWITATVYHFLTAPKLPAGVPCMGYGTGWIDGIRNFFAVTKSKEWVVAGYHQYSRNDQAFVLPPTLGMPPEIIIPKSQMAWMYDLPDHIASASEPHYDMFNGDWAFLDPIILKDPYHEHVIHKNVVRNLKTIIPDLKNEIPQVVMDVFGTDTENWIKLDVMDTFSKVIPRLSNLPIVGSPLCHDPDFNKAASSFTMDIVRMQILVVVTPKAILPLASAFLSLSNKYHFRQASRFTLPLIKQRIADLQKKDAGHPDYTTWTEPQDFFTWTYRTAQSENRPEEMHPDRIALRTMAVVFASHTTVMSIYDSIINILHDGQHTIRLLREESHRILREEGGQYTRQGLSRMHRLDSAIREAQRKSPIGLTLSTRKIVARDGVTAPDGTHFPYGTLLACPWMPIAGDETIYENAGEYDAFRYSRPMEEYAQLSEEEKKKVDVLRIKQKALATTSFDHLQFGHGRHACPGRFLAAHQLKIILSYMLLHYDFKPLAEGPKILWVIRYHVPLPVQIETRRRKAVWTPEDD
ncbi:hypothetical protein COCC4DRAFT_129752 [Bipolaris maydis ATCC 48331]|uniref:Cytochrome P450 n=2 Tax=Cochliobolus heterostrophus TaxID=5016 RepID=M2T436_COCH5|nr:uncharacterized protein COCC4DRAFT_129752 [Bipolaris maydis ATCC 48331]EMD92325.1 hypothetical protein COCHEDRAFT_1224171 [Bipolaris maydis C5]KAJ5022165.1 cytochrome P450 [Bipolaris maydis]ENI08016.1 hypothetical protein COCC4DRAFT_129752 [Bipolaris maydis ATCC 48331]KAJ5060855.1 cytochrome P450 [Bipolaris maydis]KAJ6197992.1 cytochrome P450 [Bipolaris maydis]